MGLAKFESAENPQLTAEPASTLLDLFEVTVEVEVGRLQTSVVPVLANGGRQAISRLLGEHPGREIEMLTVCATSEFQGESNRHM